MLGENDRPPPKTSTDIAPNRHKILRRAGDIDPGCRSDNKGYDRPPGTKDPDVRAVTILRMLSTGFLTTVCSKYLPAMEQRTPFSLASTRCVREPRRQYK
jgi:hypothetical protein